ncbi:MAG: GNAT family protein [bacterium]|nr:GNAT family protein [bacterium]
MNNINHINVSPDIRLELLNEDHAEKLFMLTDDNREYLKEWLPWLDGTRAHEDTLEFILSVRECNQFIIRYKNHFAGIAGTQEINILNKSAEIGYWLAEKFTGKGIMTSACEAIIDHCFTALEINRIAIKCATGNYKSQRIPERLQFTKEGILRQDGFLNGVFVDHIIYSMLKDEWRKN